MISPTFLRHELIGLEAKVVHSSNQKQIGIKGKIIDETQKTLTILHSDKEKRIIKENSILLLKLPDKTVVEVDGRVLVGRPADRVKKAIWRHW